MQNVNTNAQLNNQLLGKEKDKNKAFVRCCWLYLIMFFLTNDGFGFNFIFLINGKRLMLFICYFMILFNKARFNKFWQEVRQYKMINILMLIYMGIRIFVAVYRRDINTFTGEFLDGFLVLYLVIFIVKNYISLKKLIQFVEIALVIICLLGIVEYITGYNVYNLLDITGEFYSGELSRGEEVRVYGLARHSIGFGTILMMMFFLTCIDVDKKTIYLFRKPYLFLLVSVVIFLTGSRSPIGVYILGVVLVIIFSKGDQKMKSLLIMAAFVLMLSAVLAVTYNTSFGRYILRMITAAIDGLLGTELSLQFGGDIYTYSSGYRDALYKVFDLKYFNKFIGRGVSYRLSVVIDGSWLLSCDNSYVLLYIQLAYPGLIIFFALCGLFIFYCLKCVFKYKNRMSAAILIIIICYMINVRYVAFMGTLTHLWFYCAIGFVLYYNDRKNKLEQEGEQNAIENH